MALRLLSRTSRAYSTLSLKQHQMALKGSERLFQLCGDTVAEVSGRASRAKLFAQDLIRSFGASEASVTHVRDSQTKLDALLPELKKIEVSPEDAKRIIYWGIQAAYLSDGGYTPAAEKQVLRVAKSFGLDADDVERLANQISKSQPL